MGCITLPEIDETGSVVLDRCELEFRAALDLDYATEAYAGVAARASERAAHPSGVLLTEVNSEA